MEEKSFKLNHFWSHKYHKSVQNDSSEFEGLIHEMMSKETFINQEISSINFYDERNLSTVSNYMKDFLGIIEVDNKKCHICYNTKNPIKLVYDKMIISLDVLHTTNLTRQIYNPKYTILEKYTIVLDVIFHN